MAEKKTTKPRTKMMPGFEASYYPPEWVYPEFGVQPEEGEDAGS